MTSETIAPTAEAGIRADERDAMTPRQGPAPRRRGRLGWIPWLLAALAAAFALGLVGNPWFEAKVRGSIPAPLRGVGEPNFSEMSRMVRENSASIRSLEQRVAALEQASAQPPASPAPASPPVDVDTGASEPASAAPPPEAVEGSPADLLQRLAALEQKLGALPANGVDAGARLEQLTVQVDSIERRLALLETTATQDVSALKADSRQARQLVLLASARQALDGGQPLGPLLDRLSGEFATQSALVGPIARRAAGGPGVDALRVQLQALQPALADAWRTYETGGQSNWFQSALARLGGVVRVERRDGAPRPRGVQAVVKAADAALAQGQVDVAVRELNSLPPKVKGVASRWIADADGLARARAALASLERQSLQGAP